MSENSRGHGGLVIFGIKYCDIMDRIQATLARDNKLLSIYFTAGYPRLEDTPTILEVLEASGADMVEVGLPFSDPLADGLTIQESSKVALDNGMTTDRLFEQLSHIRERVNIPMIIMGYLNPVMSYGVETFCAKCAAIGIDGLIIPDMPIKTYEREYKPVLDKYHLKMIFLITPQTSDKRIAFIDSLSESFIYMVSSSSTTGVKAKFGQEQESYFRRIASKGLRNPQIIGFGIGSRETFEQATKYAKGAIIGSAFIKMLKQEGISGIEGFISKIRNS